MIGIEWRLNIIYVFDADGVLFADTTERLARVFAQSLKQYGVPNSEAFNYMLETTGQPIEEQYKGILTARGILAHHGEDARSIIARLADYFLKHSYAQMPKLCDDVLPALKLLKGRRMVISTNMPQDVLTERVTFYGLDRYFDDWFGRGVHGILNKGKHKALIMSRLQITEDEFLRFGALVGDGTADMRIARSWGIRAIGRCTKTVLPSTLKLAGALVVVENLEDLARMEPQLFGFGPRS